MARYQLEIQPDSDLSTVDIVFTGGPEGAPLPQCIESDQMATEFSTNITNYLSNLHGVPMHWYLTEIDATRDVDSGAVTV